MAKIKLKMNIQNFGPHKNLKFESKVKSINIGIFGNNGFGKTFISRAFRLASSNDNQKSENNILSNDQKKGNFLFKIENNNDLKPIRTLKIDLKKDSAPEIINDADYFFHVFNSDYVSENLEKNQYNPVDDIEGYILGKSQIDVSKEKAQLESLKIRKADLKGYIENAKEISINDLNLQKINKNTKEYKQITFENIINPLDVKEERELSLLKEMHQKMKSMPDTLTDILTPKFKIDFSDLYEIDKLLHTPYNKSTLKQSFVREIKLNQNFIEKGMELCKSNNNMHCPFCKQDLNESSIRIIDLYDQYIQDAESMIIKRIDRFADFLERLDRDIDNYYNTYNGLIIEFKDIKKYFPSYSEKDLKILEDKDSTISNIKRLNDMLNFKKMDVESTNFDSKLITEIIIFIENLELTWQTQMKEIEKLNIVRKEVNAEKLNLKKGICNARYLELIGNQKNNIKDYIELEQEINRMDKIIQEKESKTRINKKKEVIKSFKYFLNFFFKDKYSFNEKRFCIQFREESLDDKATHVLSDGEKGIVAFCYYLATTHTILKRKIDYDKLFFVIDDPISSMDFNYVYAVAQSIREIKSHFKIPRSRFIVLTHNFEFINVLSQNKIVKQQYILKPDKIDKWDSKLMLPYESHLGDILEISNNEKPPAHTTPNSIRHVLETICKFEYRDKSLKDFISEKDELNTNGHIYSLMQDLSHGTHRNQTIIDEIVINACKDVIEYIKNDYPGQL